MQRIMSSPNYLNATRPAFTATVQQSHFPGSAIGNIQGGAIPFSATRGAQGLGTPNSVSTNIPAWAAANYSEILKRNQI
jgi:hypothetical protein